MERKGDEVTMKCGNLPFSYLYTEPTGRVPGLPRPRAISSSATQRVSTIS